MTVPRRMFLRSVDQSQEDVTSFQDGGVRLPLVFETSRIRFDAVHYARIMSSCYNL